MSAIRNVLSYTDRVRLKRRLHAIDSQLAGNDPDIPRRFKDQMRSDFRGDESLLRREKEKLTRVLSQGEPVHLNKRERIRIEKMVEKDKAWLQKQMVPQHYLDNSTYQNKQGIINRNSREFRKAVKEGLREHTPEFQARATRYKNIMRTLDPSDPEISNLENIRPEK